MSDIIPQSATIIRQQDYFGYNPDLDFRKLTAEATGAAAGFRLVPKSALLGIPHVIIGVTYREGFPRKGVVGDYVSVECVTADQETLNRYMVRGYQVIPADTEVYPNEPVVYNDSSTGVRRAITSMLSTIGVINPGEPQTEDENVYDRAYQFWAEGEDLATSGIHFLPYSTKEMQPLRYIVARGLRVSQYEWQGNPAETYYFG